MLANTTLEIVQPCVERRSGGMRVGTVVSSVSRRGGGVFDAACRLSQSLHHRGVALQVFGLAHEGSEEDAGSWTAVRPRRFRPARWFPSFGYAPGLVRALVEADLDLVHSHGLWMYTSVANLRWSRKTKRPYVISPHGMLDPWALKNSGWRKRLARLLFEDAHLGGAACLHALNDAERDALRRIGLKNPICVVPNGVDLPDAPAGKAPPWSDAGQRRRVLLYLGRLHPKKGLPNLLTAWRQARGQLGDKACEWALVIAGWDQGGHDAELRRLAAALDVQDSVLFPGPLYADAKKAAFENADAFVLPSLSEGLPMAILEAWAYSLPVLMTAACNLPEGYASGAAVRIETDAAQMVRGLVELMEMSTADRRDVGRRGRDLVAQRFAWSRIAEQMQDVFDWILGGGVRPDCVTDR